MSPGGRAAWSTADEPGNLRVVTGDAARALLANAEFIDAWESLARACPWATPFQGAAFCRVWYTTYADVAAPVLVVRASASELSAIFPLAAFDGGRRLTVSGAEQAEYQGWLATPDNADFITAALDRIATLFSAPRLRLQYLPVGIPLDRLDGHPRWGRDVIKRTDSRGLMKLDPAETAKTLKKSGNRSKLNRLKQLGELRLDRLATRDELAAIIDEIGAHCDLRQCAINGVMPFRDDPRKKEFSIRLLEQPGLLHAAVLRVGDQVAAAHLGVASSRDVALGVIAHSPFLAAHSPGKLLLYLLSDRMAAERFETFDLTPGGGYKDRFASHMDDAEIREIYFRRRDFLRARFVNGSRRALKRVAFAAGRAVGVDQARVLEGGSSLGQGLSFGSLRRMPAAAGGALLSRVHQRRESLFYRIPASQVRGLDSSTVFARDAIDDLIHYVPARAGDPTQQEFCSAALERLENGQHVYTLVENGRLLHAAWLMTHQQQALSAWGQPYDLEPQSAVLQGDYTHPSARDRGLQRQSIVQRARDAVNLWSADWVYATVLSDQPEWRRNLEQCGFAVARRLVREVRFGRVRLS